MKTLRNSLLFCLFLFTPICTKLAADSPEKIEALLLIDSESNLKVSVKKDGQIMLNMLKAAAKATKMELNATLLQGTNVTLGRIEQWFNKISKKPHDVILFYFSGHGCKSTSALIPWPYLFLSTKRNFISLENIIKLIEAQPARLSIIFADCCNSTMVSKRVELPFLIQATISHKSQNNNFGAEVLFKKAKGHIRAIAASRGQSALAYGDGSLFTMALAKSLEKSFKKPDPTWQSIMKTTIYYCGTQQKPYASIEVK